MENIGMQFRFRFPPSIYGIYDTGEGVIYIFGEYDGEIEDVLSHEVLHWAVQKIAGKRASLDLDNIPSESLRMRCSNCEEELKTD